LAAVALLVAYLGSPFLAMQALKGAARSHDPVRLERIVDFPAVRDSLKSQFNAAFAGRLQSDPALRNNPFAGFAMLIAPVIVERAVDSLVTPDGIAAMVESGTPPKAGPAAPKAAPSASAPPAARREERARLSYAYEDLDTFKVTSASRTDPDARVDFVFRRSGLVRWRLTRIGLPLAAVAKPPGGGDAE
jgi:hypothetical protein